MAKRDGHVAALLTEQRPNLFTQAVANLEPGERVIVKLHYVEPLAYADGAHEIVFPMVAAPRFVPPTSKLRPEEIAALSAPVLPEGLRSGHDIGVTVDIDAGVPLGAISSPSHKLVTAGSHVSLAADDTVPNKDFILRWQVAGAEPAFAVIADRRGAGDTRGSFFLVGEPPAADASVPATPRELIFVVDTSSSMAGAPLAKAKEIVRRALAGMQAEDTFQIVRFDDSAGALGKDMIADKPRNVEIAETWLGQLEASGGTDMATGITAALDLPHDPARLRIVAFLTDGYVGNEDEILKLVAEKRGEARLFPVGIGSAVNRYLLEEMANEGRGALQVIRPDEETAPAVEAFYKRIDRPALTDLTIDWNGLAVEDVTPNGLPDLFLGQPLVVSGRYLHAGQATVTVHGKSGGREVSFPVAVTLPEQSDRPEVGTVWARARIAELSRQQIRGEKAETTQQIVSLALANHLLTPYTAFVAVDEKRTTKAGKLETVPVPVEVPEGVNREQGGGGMGYSGGTISGGGYGAGSGGVMGSISLGSYGTIGHGSGVGDVTATKGMAIATVVDEPMVVSAPAPSAPVPAEHANGQYEMHKATPADEGQMGRMVDDPVLRDGARRGDGPRVDAAPAHRADIQKCYVAAAARTQGLAGRIIIHLSVTAAGKLDKFEITEMPAGDDGLRDCINDKADAWTWTNGGGDFVIDMPLGKLTMSFTIEVVCFGPHLRRGLPASGPRDAADPREDRPRASRGRRGRGGKAEARC